MMICRLLTNMILDNTKKMIFIVSMDFQWNKCPLSLFCPSQKDLDTLIKILSPLLLFLVRMIWITLKFFKRMKKISFSKIFNKN